ncbi:hypothetical protein KO494_11520 [Lacinutrix sp. C3R15]|uniref:hypothetical protein n=1 Tax=Flavobacteriaceae TaxID=49546 RepID=UPI001C07F746|nr:MULTISPECIES: hypothetical protein [Flavobacteriaceae]MBU2940165.1 hypothetical protein [Lacinutrix sp. C3R15]MDO6623482.1 hypothetical protein [Oceanihabitans sp. 1_MG-2023]
MGVKKWLSSIFSKKLISDLENKNKALTSKIEDLEKNNKPIDYSSAFENGNKTLLEIKQENNQLASKIENLEKNINKQNTSEEFKNINKSLATLTQLVTPKKEVLDTFNLIDPLTDITAFSFSSSNNSFVVPLDKTKKKEVNKGLLNHFSAIPQLLQSGMLAKSFRFVFPQGVSGVVGATKQGYGTMIRDGANNLIGHGHYATNMVAGIAGGAFTIATVVVRQHYLNKINTSLKEISETVDSLLEIEFIKKEAKIESCIKFFKKAYYNHDKIKDNEVYVSAMLANIISQNILVEELLHFYLKTFQKDIKQDLNKINESLHAFTILKELFYYGKMLELKYAASYTEESVKSILSDFENLRGDYSKVFEKEIENNKALSEIIIKTNFFSRGKKKKEKQKIDTVKYFTFREYLYNIKWKEQNHISQLNNLNDLLIKPKEYVLEDNILYEVEPLKTLD